MKRLILYLLLSFIYGSLVAQNGIYKCNIQNFEDENDPSRNAERYNLVIVNVSINDITGGFVLVTMPSEDFSIKWDIIRKLDTRVKSEKSVFTYYDARLNLENIQTNAVWTIVTMQDLQTNTFHIAATAKNSSTITWYHNLMKITN